MLLKAIHTFTHFIFPNICLLCAETLAQADMLCPACQDLLPILPHHCQKCAHSLDTGQSHSKLCGQCIQAETYYDQIFACFPYKPPISQFIVKLKFNYQLLYAKALGNFIAAACQNHWYKMTSLPDVIIPVPLHRTRLKQRGFNQALEIAKTVSRILKIPIDINNLYRCKATLAQSQLSSRQRASNMQGAFQHKGNYVGKFIAIIDDVVTTGETVKAISRVLHDAGARKIHIWAAARA